MTNEEYDKLKPGDIVIEIRTGKERKFVKEYIEIFRPIETPPKGVDSLYNGVRQCEKYATIEDSNKIRTQIPLYNFLDKYIIKKHMENEIKIKVPEGKKVVQNVDSNGNIVIKFEDTESIHSKSWEEFCKNHSVIENEWYFSSNGHILGPISGPNNRDVVDDTSFLETKEDAEGILALIQLTRLHDEWVKGWEPKWDDFTNGEVKYFITRYGRDTFTIEPCYNYPHLLIFPTKEMAKEFLNCFKDLLDKAKKFI